MTAIASRIWGRLKALLQWRFCLPVVGWAVPVGAILVGLVVALLGLTVAAHETSRPLFCLSCHEMGLPVTTWRVSSHKDVACAQCHIMPGTINMFKSKVTAMRQVYLHMRGGVESSAIRAHVPDRNCKACHPQTRDLIVYHDLQITHKRHWDRGIECTRCHDRVVHGPNAAFKNTPSMNTCFECHDGKQARNDCSVCHIVLGQRSPTTFRPEWIEAHKENIRSEGEASCTRCHQADFCNNCHRSARPHPVNWLQEHPKGFRQSPKSCPVCHALPEEKGEPSFCKNCHAVRRAHALDWITVHPQKFRQDPKDCARCHDQKFCSDCHAIYRQHPDDWRETHPAQARADPKRCQVCHTQEFCQRCHQGLAPTSHTAAWPATHGAAVVAGTSGCSVCHKPEFCQSCHRSRAGKPKSHTELWLQEHGAASQAASAACSICHEQDFCSKCHGLPMPHPANWLQAHRPAAQRDPKLCTRCHDQSFCAGCHRGTMPASHQQKDWLSRHGAQAKATPAACRTCHSEALCLACHRGVQMPHPAGWLAAHGAQAKAASDRQRCASCHQDSECAKCHGLPMPHPSDWLQQHGAQAQQHPDACLRCHGAKAKGTAATKFPCTSCHANLKPSNHDAKDWLPEQHFVVGSDKPDLCTLCHGANSCDACHAKRGVK